MLGNAQVWFVWVLQHLSTGFPFSLIDKLAGQTKTLNQSISAGDRAEFDWSTDGSSSAAADVIPVVRKSYSILLTLSSWCGRKIYSSWFIQYCVWLG